MSNLSPAAQAVFWEFNRAASGKPDDWHYLPAIAAALRAAADQVVPDQEHVRIQDRRTRAWIRLEECELIRRNLLAIATELEAQ